jgi:hypothetical protein
MPWAGQNVVPWTVFSKAWWTKDGRAHGTSGLRPVTRSDIGSTISQIALRTRDGGCAGTQYEISSSRNVLVKGTSKTSVTAMSRTTSGASITVTVTQQDTRRPQGFVRLTVGPGRKAATYLVDLRPRQRGKVRFTVPHLPRGKVRLTAEFTDTSGRTLPSKATRTVR